MIQVVEGIRAVECVKFLAGTAGHRGYQYGDVDWKRDIAPSMEANDTGRQLGCRFDRGVLPDASTVVTEIPYR